MWLSLRSGGGGGRIVCSRPCWTAWDPVLKISRRDWKALTVNAHSCRFVISFDPLLLLPVKPQCSRAAWRALRKQHGCLVMPHPPQTVSVDTCPYWKWSLVTVVSAVRFWWPCDPRASGMPIITSFTDLHPIALGSYALSALSRLPASGLHLLLGHCGNKRTVPSGAAIFLLSVERVEHSVPIPSLRPQGSHCQCNLPVT